MMVQRAAGRPAVISETDWKGAIKMMTDTIPRWQRVTGWVLSGILALVFLPSAFFKIAQPKGFIEEWSKTYPAGSARPLGIIATTCTANAWR